MTAPWDRSTLILIGVAALLTAALSLAPGLVPEAMPIWPGADFSDLSTAHLSTAAFVHRTLAEAGRFPQWNPTILSGMPVLSDPLTTALYPFHWPLFLWPSAFVATGLAILHIGAGGLGLAIYLRGRGLSRAGAAAGALAFSGMPKLIGHFGLGHLTLIYSIAWTPWLIYFLEASWEADAGPRPRPRQMALATLVWGLMTLADIRWAVIAAIPAAAVVVAQISRSKERIWTSISREAAAAVLAAALIPLVQLIPAGLWQASTTRARLTLAERLELSMPAPQLASLIVPPWGAWPEWMSYVGISVLCLALIGLFVRYSRLRLWFLLLAVSVVLSLGDQLGPLGEFLWSVPGLGVLRAPARFLFLAGLAMAILAAYGADVLGADRDHARTTAMRLSAVLLAVGGVSLLVLVWPGGMPNLSLPAVRGLGMLGVAAVGCAALLLLQAILSANTAARLSIGWAVLIGLELVLFNSSLIESRQEPEPGGIDNLQAAAPSDKFRLFSPSHSLPQQEVAARGLELADGVHPLIYEPYWEYMASATGFSPEGYSVTLPPFPTGDPAVPWGVNPDPQQLGRMNVLYLVSAYPLEGSGWQFLGPLSGDGFYVYRNPAWQRRVWVEPSGLPDPRIKYNGPDQIDIVARGPGTLMISELAVPGWSVALDDAQGLHVEQGTLILSVPLSAGEHQVRLRYRTPGLLAGAAGTVAGLAIFFWLWRNRE